MESVDSIESLRAQFSNLEQGNVLWDVSNGFAVILFMVLIFMVLLYGVSSISNISKIKRNWPQYRCSPSIMPFASIYGFDAAENFQFCMGKVFELHSGDYTSSFTTLLRGVTGVLGTLLGSLNSMRLSIATMGGGINVIFQEFLDRFRQFFFRVRVSAIQIKQLMFRLYATFFAVIYIGLSAMTGMQNLGNSTLFKFLDTFCFDPSTRIRVAERGYIPIEQVKIGDILLPGKETVTATFQFFADGQPMVAIERDDKDHTQDQTQEYIQVSTNHYILHENKWIRSGDHPSVYSTFEWSGGKNRPLICLNTDKNRITFTDKLIFSDYDETTEGDIQTMSNLQNQLNNKLIGATANMYKFSEYSPSLDKNTVLKMGRNEKPQALYKVKLCDILSNGSQVVGIIKKRITEWCKLGDTVLSASTLVWNTNSHKWMRAGEFLEISKFSEPQIFIGLFVNHSSQIELSNGTIVRDYIEIFSPDSEEVYSKLLVNAPPIFQ